MRGFILKWRDEQDNPDWLDGELTETQLDELISVAHSMLEKNSKEQHGNQD